MKKLRRLYESSPDWIRPVLKRGYSELATTEQWVVSALLDSPFLATLNRADLQATPEINYYVYDDPEIHTFEPPSAPGFESAIANAVQRRLGWRHDISSLEDETTGQYTVECHEPFVAEFTDVTLFGPHAIARTADGELPLEVKAGIRAHGGSYDGMLQSTLRQFGRIRTAKSIIHPGRTAHDFDVVASLLTGRNNSMPAYGHWLAEILPRIRGIEHYKHQTGRQPVIFVNPDILDWQRKTLEMVGVKPDDLYEWPGGKVSARRYVLPKWAKSEWCLSDLEWVREKIRLSVDYKQHLGRFSSRVFLSREQMERRRVLNRDELMEALSQYDFEAYAPESLTFAEQVALFEQADILLGPTGGAFTNMIFSVDTDVVELLQPGEFHTWFFELSQVLGHEYHPLFGNSVDEHSSSNPHHQNFTVPTEAVTKLCKELI